MNDQPRARIDRWTDQGGQAIDLEVDGGVKTENIASIRAAGADAFVAGSAIFGQPYYLQVITALRAGIAQGDTQRRVG
jgi:ribulose-phosphate 3-epimerase